MTSTNGPSWREQEENNARQVTNDEYQVDNDERQTDNDAQLRTNAAQGVINSDQSDTNAAQGVTNKQLLDRLDVERDEGIARNVRIDDLRTDSNTLLTQVQRLVQSVDTYVGTMRTLSQDFKSNTARYEEVIARFDQAEADLRETRKFAKDIEAYAVSIDKKSDHRAATFKKLWMMLIVLVFAIVGTGFALNEYRTVQLCNQRNELNANSTSLIQEDIAVLTVKDPSNAALPGLKRYLNRSTPVQCSPFPW